MSADAGYAPCAQNAQPRLAIGEPFSLLLLGTGQVGRALLARLADLDALGRIRVLAAVNSRAWIGSARGLQRRALIQALTLAEGDRSSPTALVAQGWHARGNEFDVLGHLRTNCNGRRAVIVDATASDAVAERHASWLAAGHAIVTANKLGVGGPLSRWRAIERARAEGGAGYGDRATVGAGLPLLSSLRALIAGGDRIQGIEGVLSGTLAWLFERFDGRRPFSVCVREAVAAGYTEPDPRIDLGGEDVCRKLLILARSIGLPLQREQIQVDGLLPPALANASRDQFDAHLPQLDEPLQQRLQRAQAKGAHLRCIARLDAVTGRARISIEVLAENHPLAAGHGTDNRLLIRSDRYQRQPLLIQGPGAGADLTAAALLDDLLQVKP